VHSLTEISVQRVTISPGNKFRKESPSVLEYRSKKRRVNTQNVSFIYVTYTNVKTGCNIHSCKINPVM
jgi:hypothetical protein